MQTDWAWLLTFAGTAGVITALLNEAFGWVRGWFTRRARARYLALRAAVHLETFLAACEDRAADAQLYLHSGAVAGGGQTSIPELPEFPLGRLLDGPRAGLGGALPFATA
jgi:hypothetical protein